MSNIVKLAAFLLIFLNVLPASFVIDTVDVEHFFSSHHLFEYASRHGFQYGVDIIDNVGPYGYLHYPYTYAGGAYWTKTLWFALISLVYAYYATSLISRIRRFSEKLLFLIAIIFFPLQLWFPWFSYEVIPRLAVLFSAVHFLTGIRDQSSWHKNAHVIFNALFYALLTLEKASNIYFLVLHIGILSVYWLLRRQWQSAFWMVGTYIAGIAIFWLAAGQHPAVFPIYLESMAFFINAYQQIMVAEMNGEDFTYGLFYFSTISALIIYRLVVSLGAGRIRFPVEIFRSVLVAALFFLSWKHGVLRNTHSFGVFLYTVPILYSYLCLYPITTGDGALESNLITKRLSLRAFFIVRIILFLALLLVVWSNVVSYERKRHHETGIVQELSDRLSALVQYRPGEHLTMLRARFEYLKSVNSLPTTLKSQMQAGRVDEFGSVPEILLLNDLNYRPRPIPIDFIVANSALNEKNGRYYQNRETAPDFVLLSNFGLRLEDTSAYLSLLFNYQAVQSFKNWLVMEKRSTWQRLELRKLAERRAQLDEWVTLTDHQASFLWAEIDVRPTILGQARNFLYKPDKLRLDLLLEDGSAQSYSVSISQLRSGFLINPVIKSKSRLMWFSVGEGEVPWNRANAFRIALNAPGQRSMYRPAVEVRFSTIAGAAHSDSKSALMDLPRAKELIKVFAPNFKRDSTKLPVDFLNDESREDVNVEGLSGLESNDKETWRWALGPETRIKFYIEPGSSQAVRQLLLKFAFKNGSQIPDQTVTIRLNGKDIRSFSSEQLFTSDQIDADVTVLAKIGVNTLEIAYQDWNHGKNIYGAHDPRQLAVVVMRLSLQRADEQSN